MRKHKCLQCARPRVLQLLLLLGASGLGWAAPLHEAVAAMDFARLEELLTAAGRFHSAPHTRGAPLEVVADRAPGGGAWPGEECRHCTALLVASAVGCVEVCVFRYHR